MPSSVLDSTCASRGTNNLVPVTDLVDVAVANPATGKPYPGRTTIEVVNEGPSPVRLFFLGSTYLEGRLLAAGSALPYAISDEAELFARGIGGTATLQITELV